MMKFPDIRRGGYGLLCLSLLLFLGSCAVNPVTGRQELMLLTEEEEVQLGRETDAQIVKQYGLYPDPKLAGYLDQMGQRLAKTSHRPELPFHFRILDSAVVNAFAVPGGYVYITRGILASLNSEAELAGVVGHEIGHIAARHSAQQYSRAQFAQMTLGLGVSVVSSIPGFGALSGLAQMGVGMLFMSFSRENERQADSLGGEYMSRVGYDEAQMAAFFEALERMNPGSNRSGLPAWFSTHPNPEDRVKAVRAQAAEWRRRLGDRNLSVNREEFLRRIEGMVYGEDPRQGYVADGSFFHPELRFQFPIPAQWKVNHTTTSVQMVSDGKDALLLLFPTGEASPAEAANLFLTKAKGRGVRAESLPVNGLAARQVVSDHPTQKGDLRLVSYFIQKGKQVYAFHGISSLELASRYEGVFAGTMSRFQELTAPQRIGVQPDRIHLRTSQTTQTLDQLLRSFGVPDSKLQEVALLNGKSITERVPAHTLLKVVEKGP
jgi:predicted Zn-dependent protease